MTQSQLSEAKRLHDLLVSAQKEYDDFLYALRQSYNSATITLFEYGNKVLGFELSKAQASALIVERKEVLKKKLEKAKLDFENYIP